MGLSRDSNSVPIPTPALPLKGREYVLEGSFSDRCGGQTGFTLIEVLVALAIVSVALIAALRAAGQGTSGAGELRSRVLAGWVAENVLAEHRARGDWLALGIRRGAGHQGGIEFTWREEITALPNPAFRRVDVLVYAAPDESRSLARLTGFIVQPLPLAR